MDVVAAVGADCAMPRNATRTPYAFRIRIWPDLPVQAMPACFGLIGPPAFSLDEWLAAAAMLGGRRIE